MVPVNAGTQLVIHCKFLSILAILRIPSNMG